MLEAQVTQQASSSSTPSGRLPSEPESNPHEHCNCITLMERVEDPEKPKDIPLKEGRATTTVESKEKNDGGEPITFIENDSFEIPIVFPCKLPDLGSFSIPCVMGKIEIKKALCDLGVSVSLMPYSMFNKFHLGSLWPTPFSLQLADGSKM